MNDSPHAPTKSTLAYIETMLRGDTDRIQIADYLRDHVRPASPDHVAEEVGEGMRAKAIEFNEHPNSSGMEATAALSRTLVKEESRELLEAIDEGDRAHIARELADVVYVCFTAAWANNIDLDAALDEIHRAAMDKMRANVRRADGKIIKPPGFVPPDMTVALSPTPTDTPKEEQ